MKMGVQERKARQKEGLRQEILGAACQLFMEHGYEAVSMRKIADKIEYSPTTIYLHFRDKNDLMDCICAETFAKLVSRLEALRLPTREPLEGLKAGLRCYIDFGLDHPAQYRVVFMMPCMARCEDNPDLRSHEAGDRAFGSLREGVRFCAEADVIAIDDVETTAQMLWTAVHGITSLFITHDGFPWADRERLINHLLDTLIGGLKK